MRYIEGYTVRKPILEITEYRGDHPAKWKCSECGERFEGNAVFMTPEAKVRSEFEDHVREKHGIGTSKREAEEMGK